MLLKMRGIIALKRTDGQALKISHKFGAIVFLLLLGVRFLDWKQKPFS